MPIVKRLNLRHNWPLVVAGLVLIGTLSIYSDAPYKFSHSIPFDIHVPINYSELLFQYGGFPTGRLLIVTVIAVLLFFVMLNDGSFPKADASIVAILSSVVLCGGCTSDLPPATRPVRVRVERSLQRQPAAGSRGYCRTVSGCLDARQMRYTVYILNTREENLIRF